MLVAELGLLAEEQGQFDPRAAWPSSAAASVIRAIFGGRPD